MYFCNRIKRSARLYRQRIMPDLSDSRIIFSNDGIYAVFDYYNRDDRSHNTV